MDNRIRKPAEADEGLRRRLEMQPQPGPDPRPAEPNPPTLPRDRQADARPPAGARSIVPGRPETIRPAVPRSSASAAGLDRSPGIRPGRVASAVR